MTDSECPKYPIYCGSVSYNRELMSYDLNGSDYLAERTKGLPRYRIRDHTNFIEWMYREDPGEEAVLQRTREAWQRMVDNPETHHHPDHVARDPKDVVFAAERSGEKEWNLTWFCHETIDVGQSDEEVLASFQAFLDRKGVREGEEMPHHPLPKDYYCAMGAENRWRWYGESDKDGGDRKPPPCRCEGCKKSGMIRINH